ncbi:hypothetical protein F7725_021147 [Dissostichus mawsoni]|uniref:Uncharacterized protein n=1 Tax=Dissostichus mawsoni TaxID=36200 RepID=A0A7J5YH59_DISMA|nr:hypothetical protein F7725_021147 [Dissostichus mawsoni]
MVPGKSPAERPAEREHSRICTMSLYRNSAWFLKGLNEFTRSAFLSASKSFVEKDLEASLAGRGTIHMVCRNKDKAEEARAEIVKETGNKINNAGAILSEREENTEGLEKSFATNVLGVYILTKSLIPLLEKTQTPESRCLGGMLVQKLRTGNLQSERGRFDGTMVYAQHKRQQVVMTEQLAKTHTNIHFSVMHPGWVDTPAVANAMPDFHRSMKEASGPLSRRRHRDRKMVSAHLPLAWTRCSALEEQKLVSLLEDMAKTFQPH